MNRQEFKEKAKNSIDELSGQMDQLERKALEVKGEAKAKVQEKIKGLRQQKEKLVGQFKQLEQSTEDNWEKLQNAFTDSVRAFKKALDQ